YKRFTAKRNYMRLNAYLPILALRWRANTNIQVCTSTTSVVNYIGVYTLKGKTQTQTFKDIVGQILLYIKPSNLML
ncbi:uncharacterized protein BDR25DRAFT_154652, partial [Lindgomyces ingoldianus]